MHPDIKHKICPICKWQLFLFLLSSFLEAVQPVTPALPYACPIQPNLLYLLSKLFPIAYFLQFTLCSCLPLIFFVSKFPQFSFTCGNHFLFLLCYRSYFCTTHKHRSQADPKYFELFFVDTFRDLVSGRRA